MVFPYQVEAERRLVTVSLTGSVRGQDIADTIRALYHDPAWVPGFNILWDSRRIEQLLFEPEDMPRLVATQSEHEERSGRGTDVILVHRSLDYAMAQVYTKLLGTSVRQTTVTKSEDEARRLLGLV